MSNGRSTNPKVAIRDFSKRLQEHIAFAAGSSSSVPQPPRQPQKDTQKGKERVPGRTVNVPKPALKRAANVASVTRTTLRSAKKLQGATILSTEHHKVIEHGESDNHAIAHNKALVTHYTLGDEPMEMMEPAFQSKSGPRYLDGIGEVYKASELLNTLTIAPSNIAPYRVLDCEPLSPNSFPISRQKVMSSLWQRFRYRKFTIEYIPAVSQLVGGQLIMFSDFDPNVNTSLYANTEFLSRVAFSKSHHLLFNTGDHVAMTIDFSGDDQWYYLSEGEDIRLNVQATLSTMLHAAPLFTVAPTTDVSLGSLVVHYELEFCGSTLVSSFSAVPASAIGTASSPSTFTAGNFVRTAANLAGADAFAFSPVWTTTNLPDGIYRFDIMSPAGAATYPSFATIVPGGSSQRTLQLAPGMHLYARIVDHSIGTATRTFVFYQDIQSAITGDADNILRWGVSSSMSFSCKFTLVYQPPQN